jgi:hypothetical protein
VYLFDPKLLKQTPASRLNRVKLISIRNGEMQTASLTVENRTHRHDLDHLAEPFRSKVAALLHRYDHLFAWDGCAKPSKVPILHRIDTIPGAPPRCYPNRRYNPLKLEEIKRQVAKLVADGHIIESTSPYGAQPVLRPKHDDYNNITGWRLTIDYRGLNGDTVHESYPPPRLEDITDQLHGFDRFVKIDCFQGFHQFQMDPETRSKSAFRVGNKRYEWLSMPMGLTNSPATYQRGMEQVLEPQLDKTAHLFYDDVMVKGRGDEQVLANLEGVLKRFDEFNITLNPKKCEWVREEITYLGNIVSKDGLRPCQPKLEQIRAYPRPASRKQLRSFLGFANFLRRYVVNYADLAAGMTRLPAAIRKGPIRLGQRRRDKFFAN